MHLRPSVLTARGGLLGFAVVHDGVSRGAGRPDEWLAARAADGDVWAIEQVGLCRMRASACVDSLSAGFDDLRRAAHEGSPSAMYRMGAVLLDTGTPDVRHEGEMWLRRAATAGFAAASTDLGSRLCLGDGVDPAPVEGRRLLRDAVKRGSRLAMLTLAALELDSHETPRARIDELLHAAGAKNADQVADAGVYLYAQTMEGLTSATRRRLARHAAALFENARARCWQAGCNLAYLLRRGEIASACQASLDELLTPALKRGEPLAHIHHALRLASGAQCAVDWVEADRVVASVARPGAAAWWWQLLAERGDPEGDLVVGWLSLHAKLHNVDGRLASRRIDSARRGGWAVPHWLKESAYQCH